MKTDDLIAALAADERREMATGKQLALAALAGALVCGAILLTTIGVRGDILAALGTWRFDFKVALMVAVALTGIGCCLRASRPVPHTWNALIWVLPALLLAAVAMELLMVPPQQWKARLMGSNARVCLLTIPLMAVAPLALALLAVRNGAPSKPVEAGAFAGLAAAALAATFYGLHCFDDSPLFVAVWYSLAALPVVGLGALLGHRSVRW